MNEEIPGNLSPARQESIAQSKEAPVAETEEKVEAQKDVEADPNAPEDVQEEDGKVPPENVSHVLTEQDLEMHPQLVDVGLSVGSTMTIGKDLYEEFLRVSASGEAEGDTAKFGQATVEGADPKLEDVAENSENIL